MLVAASLAIVACGRSRTDTMRTLAEEHAVSAQKDSLLQDVAQTSSFIADLTRQIGTVRDLKAGREVRSAGDLEESSTPQERRMRILAQVKEITTRLNESESRLETTRRRVAELTGNDASKSRRLAAFDSVITSFRSIIETQKAQMADLSSQLDAATAENTSLRGENTRLVSTTAQVTSERDSVIAQENTVYYIVGTSADLRKQHIIERTGGFLGIGVTQVPARMLDATQFTPVDLRQATSIELPKAGAAYRVITRQDLAALESPPDDRGRLTGTLRIKDPQRFWAGSKFLILVQQ